MSLVLDFQLVVSFDKVRSGEWGGTMWGRYKPRLKAVSIIHNEKTEKTERDAGCRAYNS